jgi:predicted ester cyclase
MTDDHAAAAGEIRRLTARTLYHTVITHGRLDLLPQLIARGATGFGSLQPIGPAGFAQHIAALREGITAIRATVTDTIAEGDRIVVYWRLQGTHSGVIWGVPATGRTIDGTSISLMCFRDGLITDYRVLQDRLTILGQLGVLEQGAFRLPE